MQSKKGSATVPVALFGVSPNRWSGRFHSPNGAPRRLLPARRRDADGSGRDDRAPQLQLHCSGCGSLTFQLDDLNSSGNRVNTKGQPKTFAIPQQDFPGIGSAVGVKCESLVLVPDLRILRCCGRSLIDLGWGRFVLFPEFTRNAVVQRSFAFGNIPSRNEPAPVSCRLSPFDKVAASNFVEANAMELVEADGTAIGEMKDIDQAPAR